MKGNRSFCNELCIIYMSFDLSVKNSNFAYQNAKDVLSYLKDLVLVHDIDLVHLFLGTVTSFKVSKERLNQQQRYIEIFFSLNPQIGSGWSKCTVVKYPTITLSSSPSDFNQRKSYLALQIATRTMLKVFL